MRQVRLTDNAPWPKVTLPDGFIVDKKWKDGDATHDFRPIQQYVEFQHEENEKIDYSTWQKNDLIAKLQIENKYKQGMTQQQMLDIINNVESTEVEVKRGRKKKNASD